MPRLLSCAVSGLALAAAASPAYADDAVKAEIGRLQALVEAQAKELAAQRRRLDELALRMAVTDRSLDEARATGAPTPSAAGAVFAVAQAGPTQAGAGQASAGQGAARPAPLIPTRPVGEAPPEREPAQVQAEVLPEGMGVTLPRGRFVLEPSLEYVRSSNNRLVFRGQPIVATLLNGVFEVSDADRDTLVASLSARAGVTRRLEVEARVPFLYRNDTIESLQNQGTRVVELSSALESSGIGDVEFGARYQLTSGANGRPIWLAGLRAKSDTGEGPFDVPFDEFGSAQELATGSGYWSVEPSLSVLIPSEPVVLFASLGYGFNLERTLNREIAPARGTGTPGDPEIPRVFLRSFDPGDSISLSFGFGFAVNERFSYTMSYRHSTVLETETVLESGTQSSTQLQVGALTVLGSYRLTPRLTLNASVDVGVTEDSPDLRVAFRVPIRF